MAQFKSEHRPNQKNPKRKGFSLIEILIAFTILTITVVACTDLIANTIRNNAENSYRVQAYFLAQQGIEAVRNIRDSNWTQNIGFNQSARQQTFWGSPIYPEGGSIYLAISPVTSPDVLGHPWKVELTTPEGGDLYIVTKGNMQYFTHDGSEGIPSGFRRVIKISNTFADLDKIADVSSRDSEIKNDVMYVTSTVYYTFKGTEKEINIKTVLTDWKEGPL